MPTKRQLSSKSPKRTVATTQGFFNFLRQEYGCRSILLDIPRLLFAVFFRPHSLEQDLNNLSLYKRWCIAGQAAIICAVLPQLILLTMAFVLHLTGVHFNTTGALTACIVGELIGFAIAQPRFLIDLKRNQPAAAFAHLATGSIGYCLLLGIGIGIEQGFDLRLARSPTGDLIRGTESWWSQKDIFTDAVAGCLVAIYAQLTHKRFDEHAGDGRSRNRMFLLCLIGAGVGLLVSATRGDYYQAYNTAAVGALSGAGLGWASKTRRQFFINIVRLFLISSSAAILIIYDKQTTTTYQPVVITVLLVWFVCELVADANCIYSNRKSYILYGLATAWFLGTISDTILVRSGNLAPLALSGTSAIFFLLTYYRVLLWPFEALLTRFALWHAQSTQPDNIDWLGLFFTYSDELMPLPRPYLAHFLLSVGRKNFERCQPGFTYILKYTFHNDVATRIYLHLLFDYLLNRRSLTEIALLHRSNKYIDFLLQSRREFCQSKLLDAALNLCCACKQIAAAVERALLSRTPKGQNKALKQAQSHLDDLAKSVKNGEFRYLRQSAFQIVDKWLLLLSNFDSIDMTRQFPFELSEHLQTNHRPQSQDRNQCVNLRSYHRMPIPAISSCIALILVCGFFVRNRAIYGISRSFPDQYTLDLATGHSGPIASLAFSPDGTFLISGARDKTARVFTARTGEWQATLQAAGEISHVEISRDQKTVALCGDYVQLWNAPAWTLKQTLCKLEGGVKTARLSSDGTRLGVVSWQGVLRIWTLSSGHLDMFIDNLEPDHFLMSEAAFSPDLSYVAILSRDGDVAINPPTRLTLWTTIDGHCRDIGAAGNVDFFLSRNLLFSPDGGTLAARACTSVDNSVVSERGSKNYTLSIGGRPQRSATSLGIYLWDVRTGNLRQTIISANADFFSFSPDGRRLACCENRMTLVDPKIDASHHELPIEIWDLSSDRRIALVRCRASRIDTLEFSKGGDHLIAIGSWRSTALSTSSEERASVSVWHIPSSRLLRRIELSNYIGTTAATALTSTCRTLAAGGEDGSVLIFPSLDSSVPGKPINTSPHLSSVSDSAVSPDGTRLAVVTNTGVLYQWNCQSGEVITDPMDGIEDFVMYSPDSLILAASAKDHSVRIMDSVTGACKVVLPGAEPPIGFGNDGAIITGSTNSSLVAIVWSRYGHLLKEIHRPPGCRSDWATGLEKLAADATTLAAISPGEPNSNEAYKVYLWNSRTGRLFKTFTIPREYFWDDYASPPALKPVTTEVKQLTVSRHASVIAVCTNSLDPTKITNGSTPDCVWVWDTLTGRLLQKFDDIGEAQVTAMAISIDGRQLAIGAGGDCYLFDIASGRLQWQGDQAGYILDLAFTSDGRGLVGASSVDSEGWEESEITSWDVRSGRRVAWVGAQDRRELQGNNICQTPYRLRTAGATVELFDWERDRKIATFIPVTGRNSLRDWLTITPTGYYCGSPKAAEEVWWRDQRGAHTRLDQYHDRFFRRDLVKATLAGYNVEPPQFGEPPVAFFGPNADDTTHKDFIELDVIGTDDHNVAGCEVWIDEQPISQEARRTRSELQPLPQSRSSDSVVQLKLGSSSVPWGFGSVPPDHTVYRTFRYWAPLRFDNNKKVCTVRAVVFDEQGNKSLPIQRFVYRPGATQPDYGRLYAVVVGVGHYQNQQYNLPGADSDATSVGDMLQRQAGLRYRKVNVIRLINDEASSSRVRKALNSLGNLAEKENDTVVVFLAGHGEEDQDGKFYYGTCDMDKRNLARTTIGLEDLQRSLGNVLRTNVRRYLFADICNSGLLALRPSDMSGTRLETELNIGGVAGLGASSTDGNAYTDPTTGHGYFTGALLEALDDGKAADREGNIRWVDIVKYVSDRVTQRTHGQQTVTELPGRAVDPREVLAIKVR